jgi:hypothetical protein
MYQSITERALKNMGKVPREELLEEIVKLKGEVEELKEKILELEVSKDLEHLKNEHSLSKDEIARI